MADNSWNALVASVNDSITKMSSATSSANGAAASASESAQKADEATGTATEAAGNASLAAQRANDEAAKWEGATVGATQLAEGSAPTCTLTEENGVKKLTYGIPKGDTGPQGPQGPAGPMGESGVTFSLSGTTLTITTVEAE